MARPSDPYARIDLLRAAETVFVEHGLDRARVEQITALAGRSKGSFYLHFESKEDAFRQIVETLVARLGALLDSAPPERFDQLSDPAEYLEAWLDIDVQIFDYLWQNRGVARLVLEGGKSAAFGYLVDAFAERSRAQIKQALALAVERGFYRADLDVELASLVVSGAYDRVARELVRLPRRPDLRRWIGEVQRLVLRGIAGPTLTRFLDSQVSNHHRPVARKSTTPKPSRRPRAPRKQEPPSR